MWGEGVLGDYVIVIGVLCRVFHSSRCSRFQCIKMRPAAPAVLLRLIQALRVLRAPPASLSKPLCVYLSRTHTCILMCFQCGVIICHCGCLFPHSKLSRSSINHTAAVNHYLLTTRHFKEELCVTILMLMHITMIMIITIANFQQLWYIS